MAFTHRPLSSRPFLHLSCSGVIECKEPIEVVSYKIGVCKVSSNGKDCTTTFQKIGFNGHSSVVLCKPLTGRMHQIRVHLQYLGKFVVGRNHRIISKSSSCSHNHHHHNHHRRHPPAYPLLFRALVVCCPFFENRLAAAVVLLMFHIPPSIAPTDIEELFPTHSSLGWVVGDG